MGGNLKKKFLGRLAEAIDVSDAFAPMDIKRPKLIKLRPIELDRRGDAERIAEYWKNTGDYLRQVLDCIEEDKN